MKSKKSMIAFSNVMVAHLLRQNIFSRSRGFCYWINMSRSVKRIVTICLVALLPACASTRHAAVKDTTKTFKTVVVDAGHGGKDSGAYRRYGPPEKLVTLDVAERLNRNLRESELKTVMTRSSDVFIPLDERVNI